MKETKYDVGITYLVDMVVLEVQLVVAAVEAVGEVERRAVVDMGHRLSKKQTDR